MMAFYSKYSRQWGYLTFFLNRLGFWKDEVLALEIEGLQCVSHMRQEMQFTFPAEICSFSVFVSFIALPAEIIPLSL